MSELGEAPRRLDIGRALQDTFGVLGRNFLTFVVLAVVMVGVPSVVIGFLELKNRGGDLFAWQSIVAALLGGLFGLILQAAIIHGTVSDLNGKVAPVGQSLAVGFRSFLPILAIGILFYIVFIPGLILLAAPGLLVACAWCVAVPVYVLERPGITRSLRRSAELTRGNRWRIFALFLLYFLVVMIVETVMGAFDGTFSQLFGDQGSEEAANALSPLQTLAVKPLISVINAVIGGTGVAVLYAQLRQVREGVGPQGLAAIFDREAQPRS